MPLGNRLNDTRYLTRLRHLPFARNFVEVPIKIFVQPWTRFEVLWRTVKLRLTIGARCFAGVLPLLGALPEKV